MSLVTAGPLARRQLSPFLSHDSTNQQVPDSPLSAFFGTHIPSPPVARLCSPSSGSPLAQVPDCGSPLLRQLLDCRKRQREEGTTSPSPASKRANRDSHRVPNSIIVIKRTAQPSKKEEQVVPSIPNPEQLRSSDCEAETEHTNQFPLGVRKLPDVVKDGTRVLDLFGEAKEIFASSHEE